MIEARRTPADEPLNGSAKMRLTGMNDDERPRRVTLGLDASMKD